MLQGLFRIVFLIFILFFTLSLSPAQSNDTTEILKLYHAGRAMFDSAEYDRAALFFKQARDEFAFKKIWGHYANTTEAHASTYHVVGKPEQASRILREGIDSLEKHLGPESFFVGSLYNSLGGGLLLSGRM